jgi:ribosomal protein L31
MTTEVKEKKKKLNLQYHTGVQVTDLDGNTFTINSTSPGPMRVEICHMSHPAYNPDKKIERKAKGHMEKFLEKQKRMTAKSAD